MNLGLYHTVHSVCQTQHSTHVELFHLTITMVRQRSPHLIWAPKQGMTELRFIPRFLASKAHARAPALGSPRALGFAR